MIPPSNPQRSQSACSSLTDLRSYDFFGRITENVQMDSGPSRKIFFTMSFLLAFAFVGEVEEKFGEQNFWVLSEMRILAKIRVVILDLVGYVDFLTKFGAKSDFRV